MFLGACRGDDLGFLFAALVLERFPDAEGDKDAVSPVAIFWAGLADVVPLSGGFSVLVSEAFEVVLMAEAFGVVLLSEAFGIVLLSEDVGVVL